MIGAIVGVCILTAPFLSTYLYLWHKFRIDAYRTNPHKVTVRRGERDGFILKQGNPRLGMSTAILHVNGVGRTEKGCHI